LTNSFLINNERSAELVESDMKPFSLYDFS